MLASSLQTRNALLAIVVLAYSGCSKSEFGKTEPPTKPALAESQAAIVQPGKTDLPVAAVQAETLPPGSQIPPVTKAARESKPAAMAGKPTPTAVPAKAVKVAAPASTAAAVTQPQATQPQAPAPQQTAAAAPPKFEATTITGASAPEPPPASTTAKRPGVNEPNSEAVKAEAPKHTEEPRVPNRVTIKAGSLLAVRLNETLSSQTSEASDTFTAYLQEPLVVDGFVIAEKGARVVGKIVNVADAGKVKGAGTLEIALTQLQTADKQKIAITTDGFTRKGDTFKKSDAVKVGLGAAIGAAIGAAAGEGKGAAVGAGAGAAAGGGWAIGTKNRHAVLEAETLVRFRLNADVPVVEKLTN